MMTEAFSRNISRLFSKLKLVTDNFLFIYTAANWEATESRYKIVQDGWMYSFSLEECIGICLHASDFKQGQTLTVQLSMIIRLTM